MIYATKITRMERKYDHKRDPEEFYSQPGDSDGLTYEYQYIDGVKTLVPSGKVNRQELIDSFAESQDINVMINKFLSGDTSVLNPNSGQYGDFTNCPDTYAELFNRVEHCKNVFDSMPVDIKEQFDNSYEVFWTNFGSERFDKIFKEFNNEVDVKPVDVMPVEPPVEGEVK